MARKPKIITPLQRPSLEDMRKLPKVRAMLANKRTTVAKVETVLREHGLKRVLVPIPGAKIGRKRSRKRFLGMKSQPVDLGRDEVAKLLKGLRWIARLKATPNRNYKQCTQGARGVAARLLGMLKGGE